MTEVAAPVEFVLHYSPQAAESDPDAATSQAFCGVWAVAAFLTSKPDRIGCGKCLNLYNTARVSAEWGRSPFRKPPTQGGAAQ